MIAQTMQGQLDIAWLDIAKNSQRQATYPNAHKIIKFIPMANTKYSLSNNADGYQSFGHIYPTHCCFDYHQLNFLLSQLKIERIKAVLKTNKGCFIINGTENNINYVPTSPSITSRIEIITRQNQFQDILSTLNQCTIVS